LTRDRHHATGCTRHPLHEPVLLADSDCDNSGTGEGRAPPRRNKGLSLAGGSFGFSSLGVPGRSQFGPILEELIAQWDRTAGLLVEEDNRNLGLDADFV